jgi:hypothetical protein
VTPLTSPLQILRRNMMSRPGTDSPGFLSPQTRFSNLPEVSLHPTSGISPFLIYAYSPGLPGTNTMVLWPLYHRQCV